MRFKWGILRLRASKKIFSGVAIRVAFGLRSIRRLRATHRAHRSEALESAPIAYWSQR